MQNKIFLWIILPFLFCGCAAKEKKTPIRTFPVTVAEVIEKDVPLYLDSIGHADPINSVDIKTQVEGQLTEVHFHEGIEVLEGDLLFAIDPKPYEAALQKAQATLAENQANLALAQDKVHRYGPLAEQEYIAILNYEELKTDVERYQAIIQQNKAEVDTAQINLNYCWIHSPINGKTGLLQITKGNLVSNNGKTLVSVNQIAPIYVTFALPERERAHIQKSIEKGTIAIRASATDLEKDSLEGTLDMIDNSINTSIAMVQLRATFENKERILWPGEFVKVRFIFEIQNKAVLIPYQAVQMTTAGPIAYVVKEDSTVELRNLSLGQREDDWIIVVKGLQPKETVVTEGQINLFSGAHVAVPKKEASS